MVMAAASVHIQGPSESPRPLESWANRYRAGDWSPSQDDASLPSPLLACGFTILLSSASEFHAFLPSDSGRCFCWTFSWEFSHLTTLCCPVMRWHLQSVFKYFRSFAFKLSFRCFNSCPLVFLTPTPTPSSITVVGAASKVPQPQATMSLFRWGVGLGACEAAAQTPGRSPGSQRQAPKALGGWFWKGRSSFLFRFYGKCLDGWASIPQLPLELTQQVASGDAQYWPLSSSHT